MFACKLLLKTLTAIVPEKLASETEALRQFELLNASGCLDIQVRDYKSRTLLSEAINLGYMKLFFSILACGFTIDRRSCNPMICAIKNHNITAVRVLLTQFPYLIYSIDSQGNTVLMLAMKSQAHLIVNYFLSLQAYDTTFKNKNDHNIFNHALIHDNYRVILDIIDKYPEYVASYESSFTSFFYEALHNNAYFVFIALYLYYGKYYFQENEDYRQHTIYFLEHISLTKIHPEALTVFKILYRESLLLPEYIFIRLISLPDEALWAYFITGQCFPNIHYLHRSNIHQFTYYASYKKCSIGLYANLDWCVNDRAGKTPLMLATLRNDPDVLEYILRSGASSSINAVDNTHNSALMYASCLTNCSNVFKLLLQFKADVYLVNQYGDDVFSILQKRGQLSLLGYMLKNYSFTNRNQGTVKDIYSFIPKNSHSDRVHTFYRTAINLGCSNACLTLQDSEFYQLKYLAKSQRPHVSNSARLLLASALYKNTVFQRIARYLRPILPKLINPELVRLLVVYKSKLFNSLPTETCYNILSYLPIHGDFSYLYDHLSAVNSLRRYLQTRFAQAYIVLQFAHNNRDTLSSHSFSEYNYTSKPGNSSRSFKRKGNSSKKFHKRTKCY